MRIAIVSNQAWNLYNFRLNLMRALKAAGHEVIAVAPEDRYVGRILEAGFEFEPVRISGGGVNPFREIGSVARLRRVFKDRRVDLVLSYTPKGNLYSAMASLTAGVAFAPNVSGLGYAFVRQNWVTSVATLLYRLTFRRATKVFFQNLDDRKFFVQRKLVPEQLTERLPGSGVDLQRFTLTPLPDLPDDAPVFLMMARLLRDKGVYEFVDAARLVRARYPHARFLLVGSAGVDNPSAVQQSQLDTWVQKDGIELQEATDHAEQVMRIASCIVLPSYREGLPRVLLEASATGRPVITTDVPGCRDAVLDGQTGFLCAARSGADLADIMMAFIALPGEKRAEMGLRARQFVTDYFDEQRVIHRYLALVDFLADRAGGGSVLCPSESVSQADIAHAADAS